MKTRIVSLFVLIWIVCNYSNVIGQKKEFFLSVFYEFRSTFIQKLEELNWVVVRPVTWEMINTFRDRDPQAKSTEPIVGALYLCEVVTVEELGFPYGASLDAIYKEANRRGLKLCDAALGPNLIIEGLTRDIDVDDIEIAMNPIRCSDGSLRIFRIWFDGFWGYTFSGDDVRTYLHNNSGYILKPETTFLFTKY